MSNEKSTGKTAGSISKYRQLGGGKHSEVEKSETPNVQTSESPDIQQSKSENIQTAETLSTQSVESPSVQQSKTSEVQSSESVKGHNMNSLAVQTEKGTHKGRAQKTIYLPPALAKRLNFASVEEEREISEIVTDALEAYFKNKVVKENS